VPRCTLNHAFFQRYVCLGNIPHNPLQEPPFRAVAGFLRSYSKLIRHESDFNIAVNAGLLLDADITWNTWVRFIAPFSRLLDGQVDNRYVYDELRLTRLNFYWPLRGRAWNYQPVYTRYAQLFSRFIVLYLFIFSAVSVVLGCFQVALAAEGLVGKQLKRAAYEFAVAVSWTIIAGLSAVPVLYGLFLGRELVYACTH
jgi:hypothetical protein